METPLLMSLSEIKTHAEACGQKFDSLEAAFVDAYMHGEFHEHRPDYCWTVIGRSLTDKMIAELVPTVLNPLVNHAQGDDAQIKQLMEFHQEMVKWLHKRLTSTEPLFNALRNVRNFIVQDAASWMVDVLRLLGLI